jgi:hypothetical protein
LGIYLAEQTRFFLEAILLGAAFGLLYDALRITRLAIPAPYAVVFVEDVLYFLFLGMATFLFLMRTIDGQVRFFILVGAVIGALLYFMSVSVLVMMVSGAIIKAVKAFIGFIVYRLFVPIYRLLYSIVALIIRPVRFFINFLKKIAQRCKYRLKVRRKVLYNHFKSVPARRKRKNKRKHKPDDAEEKEG